ncbi:wax ester/triacylglycerol synthase domain-containing protein [Spirillospora sp. NPDC127200]
MSEDAAAGAGRGGDGGGRAGDGACEPFPGWAEPGRLNGVDTLMWRAGRHRLGQVDTVQVWVLDGVPEQDRLQRCFEWAVRKAPRLTQRVIDPVLQVGSAVWAPDPMFRLSNHLRRVRLAAPGGLRELLDLAEWQADQPLDPTRPPWLAVLAEGYEGDKAALILRNHHSLTDGMGLVFLQRHLVSLRPDAQAPPCRPRALAPLTDAAPAAHTSWSTRLKANADVVGRDARQALRFLGHQAQRLRTDPVRAAELPGRLARSALQVRHLAVSGGSPLLRNRERQRRFEVIEFPSAALRQAAATVDGDTTAACVAAVCGGFAAYHRHYDSTAEALSVAIPVNQRDRGQNGPGSHVSALHLQAPLGRAEPAERLRAMHDLLGRARRDHANLTPVLAGIGSWIYGPLLTACAPAAARRIDAWVTIAPGGRRRPEYLAGARLLRVFALGPAGASACNATLVLHQDTCTLALNLDPAAITDVPLLCRLINDSIQDTFATTARASCVPAGTDDRRADAPSAGR